MIKYKFRAEDLTGTMRYGDLIQWKDGAAIRHWLGSISPEYEVKRETISQRIGFDSSGNEIYEGDTLIDEQGEEFCPELYCDMDFKFGDRFVGYRVKK